MPDLAPKIAELLDELSPSIASAAPNREAVKCVAAILATYPGATLDEIRRGAEIFLTLREQLAAEQRAMQRGIETGDLTLVPDHMLEEARHCIRQRHGADD